MVGTVTREENSATFGYDVWKGLTPFVGYFQNTTDLFSTGATGFSYREYGPYFGLAYSYGFESGGRLSVSFARAKANGTASTRPVGSPDIVSNSGTVTGKSYGISWSAPLTKDVSYRLGYKATRYKFKLPGTLFGDLEAAEDYDAVYVGVSKYF